VKAVEWPGEAPRYERADKRHHHHFHCRACGEVFDVEGCVPGIAALVPAGFSLENHEIFLSGTCAHCKEATL
jgi:Fur family ferric uptake transcriptional regulator